MRIISILFVCLFVAVASINAQTTPVSAANTQTENSIDAQIRQINQSFRSTYNLNNDQQIAVKKAVGTFVENSRSATVSKEALRNDFHNQVQKILPAEQYNHYKNVQIATVNQQLDAIFIAAKGTKAGIGK